MKTIFQFVTAICFAIILRNGKPNNRLHTFIMGLSVIGVGGIGNGAVFKLEGGCGLSKMGGSLNLASRTWHADHSCSALFLDSIIDQAVSKDSSCDVANYDQEILQREISECPFYDFLICDTGAAAEYGFDLYYKHEISPGGHARTL
jgi:hypothetical protein